MPLLLVPANACKKERKKEKEYKEKTRITYIHNNKSESLKNY